MAHTIEGVTSACFCVSLFVGLCVKDNSSLNGINDVTSYVQVYGEM